MFIRLLHWCCWSSLTILLCYCQPEESDAPGSGEEDCITRAGAIDGQIVPNQYIVVFDSSGRGAQLPGARQRQEQVLRSVGLSSDQVLSSFEGAQSGMVCQLSPSQVQQLETQPGIDRIEPDRIIAIAACFSVVEPRSIRWNVVRTGFGDGRGKTAWVLDTGVDLDHPDLNVDQTRSRSFISGKPTADDENGHGTHVAGIIGGKNNRIGVLGVASEATIVGVRVLDREGEGLLSNLLAGLAYVEANGKAGDVANLSLGGDYTSVALDRAVRNLALRNIYVAIAAGNEGRRASEISPARVNAPGIFTVSAVDSLGNFARFSNFGNEAVDFAAPGVRILSTYSQNRYAVLSGTSMAAPHVAGLLLLNGPNLASRGVARNDPDGLPDPIAAKRE